VAERAERDAISAPGSHTTMEKNLSSNLTVRRCDKSGLTATPAREGVVTCCLQQHECRALQQASTLCKPVLQPATDAVGSVH